MLTKNLSRQSWANELKHAFDHEVDAFALATSTEGHKKALEAIRAKLSKQVSKEGGRNDYFPN